MSLKPILPPLVAMAFTLSGAVIAQEVDHSAMDHSAMNHADMPQEDAKQLKAPVAQSSQMDHSQMDHSQMDHSQMDHSQMDHSQMDHSGVAKPVAPLPPITDADRLAAFPVLSKPHAHGVHAFGKVLIDELEVWDADPGRGLLWSGQAWYGTDLDKLWLRSSGERIGAETESADLEVLYGRSVSPWWDVVAGIRHDFKPGSGRDYLALGLIGIAPYKFEVSATAYLGESGHSAVRLEAEYETLLSARWVLQPKLEADFHGKAEPEYGIGRGLNTLEAGLRLRYEIRREFAPYLGLGWERAFGQVADLRRAEGESRSDFRLVAGLRLWF